MLLIFGQRFFRHMGRLYLKRVDQQQETVKSQPSAINDKADLRMCCTSTDKADDLNNIEFVKNINEDKYHVNHANHRKLLREAKS
ncbi:hypothetical protein RMATCC62417_14559 [Rhizopus microsporus]|nr:hypothetical protein RMATCC62417_14559 [Rhizopus microsporus]